MCANVILVTEELSMMNYCQYLCVALLLQSDLCYQKCNGHSQVGSKKRLRRLYTGVLIKKNV